jgi:hypothetical protein
MQRLIVTFSFVVAGLGVGTASASDKTPCGSSPAGTNMPNGVVFLSAGAGPVKATLNGVGETRSHSGISHGFGMYTHSTMHEPNTRDWDESGMSCGVFGDYCCDGPLRGSELQNGYPGMEQINGGGLYTFYYLNGAAVDFLSYQRSYNSSGALDPSRGEAVANWLWSSSNYSSAGNGVWRVGFSDGGGAWSNYSFYQYRNYQGINYGSTPWNRGDVCSTSLAYAQHMSGQGDIWNNRSHDQVPGMANSYAHNLIVPGIDALYNAIYNDCQTGSDLLSDIGSALTCWEDICDDAARQVAGCFADGINGTCNHDTDRWAQVRNNQWDSYPWDGNGYAVTVSISPDNIGGWGGWQFGTSSASIWSRDGSQTTAWNNGGSVYGCFF